MKLTNESDASSQKGNSPSCPNQESMDRELTLAIETSHNKVATDHAKFKCSGYLGK